MQVCFVGNAKNGKSTALTLLHLRATELEGERKLNYEITPVSQGVLDLIDFGHELNRGRPVPANPMLPKDNVCRAYIDFTFPSLIPCTKKKLEVNAVDGAGELQEQLFRSSIGRNGDVLVDDILKRLEDRGIFNVPAEELSRFFGSVLDSDAYLFTINAKDAVVEMRTTPKDKKGPPEGLALDHFVTNVRFYKKSKKQSLKGFGILLTHTDAVPNGNFNPNYMEQFMETYMNQGWIRLEGLCHAHKIPRMLFYHRLYRLQAPDPDDTSHEYEVEGNSIRYPTEQYDRIILWLHSMV